MSLYDILVTIVIGAVSGWLAGFIMNSKGSLIRNIILGIIGGLYLHTDSGMAQTQNL